MPKKRYSSAVVFGTLVTFVALAALVAASDALADRCPAGCYCDEKRSGAEVALKVNCHPLTSGAMDFASLPPNTFHLDMAKYGLKQLRKGMFRTTPQLQKLDLQGNEIVSIEPATFQGLEYLEVLDLSRNYLEVIESDTFKGLARLDRLKLNDNRIQKIWSGAFDDLRSLTKLDISENPFICDCDLLWFLRWLDSPERGASLANSVKAKCALPIALADAALRKINPEALTCDPRAASTPHKAQSSWRSLHIAPDSNQIAFEGDSLQLSCKAEQSADLRIKWLVRGKELKSGGDENVTVTEARGSSVLRVRGLSAPHSGEWTCMVEADGAVTAGATQLHRSVNVLVVTSSTRLCQPIMTTTDRGTYTWGAAVGGYTVQQGCKRAHHNQPFAFVYLVCRENGEWAPEVNASQCAYTSDVTDALHKFASMNTTFTLATLMESAKYFLNFTDEPHVFSDLMDLVYFSRAVENYLPYISSGGDLGHYIMSMVENAMDVRPDLLSQAQAKDAACSRLQKVAVNVTSVLPAFQHHTNKLAVEGYDIKPQSFDGVTCTWYSTGVENATYQRFAPKRVFHCSQTNNTLPSGGKVVLASVSVPKSIHAHVRGPASGREAKLPLVFAVFANASLFPSTPLDFNVVNNTVIGVTFAGAEGGGHNLTDSVSIVIRSAEPFEHALPAGSVVPVWWDASGRGGLGVWRPQPCQLISAKSSLIWFSCNQIGFFSYYTTPHAFSSQHGNGTFRFHHPVIYVGAIIGIVLISASIITYGISFSSIMMARELKHSLLNIWIAQVLLIFLFASGVHQTEHEFTCKSVGIFSHYLTLCNLIWLVISMYVVQRKANQHKLSQDGQLSAVFIRPASAAESRTSRQPAHAFVSRCYVLGWGLAAILCGVSVVINADYYATRTHCFMKLTPFIVGIVAPALVASAVMVGLALSAWCIVPSDRSAAADDDGACPTPNAVVSEHMPDRDKTVRSLILAHAYIYVLLLSAWMCGSLAVAKPLKGSLPFEELIFSVLFTVSSISLGIFVFVYFCASRRDVQECWRSPLCMLPVFLASPECHALEETSNLVSVGPRQMTQGDVVGYCPEGDAGEHLKPAPHQEQYFSPMPMPGSSAFNINHDGFQIYNSSSSQRDYSASHGRVKDINMAKKESDASSDHVSLNNVNHLRRGYIAPVNSAGVSEAEYGYGQGFFAPSSSKVNNLNIHVEPPTYRPSKIKSKENPQPKTSSPASGSHIAPDQDLTVSPLLAPRPAFAAPRAALYRSVESVDPADYSETSTIKVGAPCQMASFADFPSELDASGSPSSKGRWQARPNHRRATRPAGFTGVPAAIHEDEDLIQKASDLDHLETQSGVSSRSARSKRSSRDKKPTRRRPRVPDVANASQMGLGKPRSAEDQYFGDDDRFDTLDRGATPVESQEQPFDDILPTSSHPQDLSNRETSV